jgi:hypothetical protein
MRYARSPVRSRFATPRTPSVPNSLATTRYLTGIDTTVPGPGSPVLGPFVLVLVAATIPEGLLAKGLLEAEGIPVSTKGESEGPYRMGPMYLWVPAELELQARMILEEALDEGAKGDGPLGGEVAKDGYGDEMDQAGAEPD